MKVTVIALEDRSRRDMVSSGVWPVTVGLLIGVLSLLNVAPTHAQPGFLSIDCGVLAAYTDPNLGIYWVPDSPFITTGLNSANATSSLYTYDRYKTVRYFPEPRSKHCYVLPATFNGTYLLRTVFLYGDYDGGADRHKFHLTVDTYDVGEVLRTDTSERVIYEITLVATAANIYVCLVPDVVGVDVPFISFLELRSLGIGTLYPKANGGYYLFNIYRKNFGSDTSLRYPADKYDRTWYAYGTEAPKRVINTTQAIDLGKSRDQAPVALLQTAQYWLKSETFNFAFNVTGDSQYIVYMWFAEIDPQAVNKTRKFQVGIDNTMQPPINIVNATGGMYKGYEYGYTGVNLTSSSILTFAATADSDLGPILNGIEVYLISDLIQPRTDSYGPDASVLDTIKTQLNLSDWTGDPCLTVPYDWVNCSTGTNFRITGLQLAGYNLTGEVPAAVNNLTALTLLWLENNELTGSIPDLSSLSALTQLHLQNNRLSGPLPQWLASLPNLQQLYVYGNNLTGEIPSSLINKPGLDFKYTPGNSALICAGNLTTCASISGNTTIASSTTKSSTNLGLIIGCVVGGIAVLAILIFLIVFFLCCRKPKPVVESSKTSFASAASTKKTVKDPAGIQMHGGASDQAKAYTLAEVKAATDNFKNQIGEGGFGPVYTGCLPDGKEVAVKRCRPSNKHGTAEFANEVDLFARVHHRNLVSLVGHCQEGGEQILIYEYMPNGDLRKYLHGDGNDSGLPKTILPWKLRLEIALSAAQGLEYLHTGCSPSIIHRDVKTSNILLKGNMEAKVADFGLSKLTSNESTQHVTTDVKGTTGYLDPEYLETSHLTDKSDVYGFGVVLLELVCGREAIDRTRFDRGQVVLVEWVRPLLSAGNIRDVVDPSLGENYDLESMWKMAEIGMLCVEPKAVNRPTMTEVVRDLREAIALESGETQGDYSRSSKSTVDMTQTFTEPRARDLGPR